ncbi:MAG: PepSY-associated TM helix domain-containing protein [Bacteroidales bacterium]|nr:PepSY-associated TM helix domain-containing protein [Bacteroidales bacterium]MBN2755824.1 PepSY-associated TM helix domain-containing protein [Bacteroidales bacterium]
MKLLRRWSRILHRDIGFLFIGTSLIYGLSGIALNHLNDWNPNYSVETKSFKTELNLKKENISKENILELVDNLDDKDNYRKHYFPQNNILKIFLNGGSSIVINTQTGEGNAEFLKKRAMFYQVNFLHYNPNNWWKWFSDIYAFALIFLALTSLFMIKGKKGLVGTGGIYLFVGILIPILFLIFSL